MRIDNQLLSIEKKAISVVLSFANFIVTRRYNIQGNERSTNIRDFNIETRIIDE